MSAKPELEVLTTSELVSGIPGELDDRLQSLCAELRDLGNALEALGQQLQTAPEHVNPQTLERVIPEIGEGVERIRTYRELLQELWETQK